MCYRCTTETLRIVSYLERSASSASAQAVHLLSVVHTDTTSATEAQIGALGARLLPRAGAGGTLRRRLGGEGRSRPDQPRRRRRRRRGERLCPGSRALDRRARRLRLLRLEPR